MKQIKNDSNGFGVGASLASFREILKKCPLKAAASPSVENHGSAPVYFEKVNRTFAAKKIYKTFFLTKQRTSSCCFILGKKLTAVMERHLARCVVSEEDLRDLGTLGFGVRRHIIDAALFNHHRSITGAATVVIKAWSDEYLDKEKAYEDLCEALRKIHKNAWISDINRD